MRIKATDPEAAEVAAVFVDGKRVPFPVEFDTEEGWVLAAIPVVPKHVDEVEIVDPDSDNPEATGEAQWIEKRLEGEVKVVLHETVD